MLSFEILIILQSAYVFILPIVFRIRLLSEVLWVYRFRDGKPELLLAKGSAAGVELRQDPDTGDPQVWVGIENWDDPEWNYASGKRLWNVYRWTGQAFEFNQAFSTTSEVALDDRTDTYVERVISNLDTKQ
jgi:hypothetical protein